MGNTKSSHGTRSSLTVYFPPHLLLPRRLITHYAKKGSQIWSAHGILEAHPLLTCHCKGFCAGHYRSSVPTDTTDSVALCATSHPPSSMLKELFNKLQGRPITDQFVHDAAKEVLLTPEEVCIWLEHLSTVLQNRRRGAAKAAATRRAKRAKNTCVSNLQSEADPSTVRDSEASCYCGSCRKEYQNETDDVEVWIGCDMCESWYCMSCEGLTNPPELDMYICSKCR